MTGKVVSIVDKVFEALKERSRYLSYEDDGNDDRYVNVKYIEESKQELEKSIREAFWNNRDIQEILLGNYENPKLYQNKENSAK